MSLQTYTIKGEKYAARSLAAAIAASKAKQKTRVDYTITKLDLATGLQLLAAAAIALEYLHPFMDILEHAGTDKQRFRGNVGTLRQNIKRYQNRER